MTQLTNPKVFEAPFVCPGCGLLGWPQEGHEGKVCSCEPHRTCDELAPVRKKLDHFLPVAYDVKEIHLRREMWRKEDELGTSGGSDGEALVDIPQVYVYHSPDGFEWGYGGSGPSDLALNILALFVPPPEAWRLHHYYKDAVIARVPAEGCTIEPGSVREWVAAFWAHEKEAST